MLSIVHLRSLIAIADTGSFSEAARSLSLAQSTVSQHVARLERMLGVRLVERDGGARLTAAGVHTCRYARGIQRLHGRIVARSDRGRLTVGASSNIGTYLLEPVMRKLGDGADAPQVDIRIASNPEVADALDHGELDLGLMEWWDDRPGFIASRWRDEGMVVIVPPGHRWAARDSLTANELAGVPLIGGERGTGTGRLLQEYLHARGVRPCPGMALGNTEAVKRAVANGLGVSIVLAGTVSREVARGELHAIPLSEGGIRKQLHLVYPKELVGEPGVGKFRGLLDCNP